MKKNKQMLKKTEKVPLFLFFILFLIVLDLF